MQEEGENNEEKEVNGKEKEGACHGFPTAQTDHANPLMCYQVSTWVRCKAHYLRCPLGGLDCEQWPLPSGTLCYFANVQWLC